jgi:hypothetical protein
VLCAGTYRLRAPLGCNVLTMRKDTVESVGRAGPMSFQVADTQAPPLEVFYVVLSNGALGERTHLLRSALFETRSQADIELARLQAADTGADYGVWKSVTYIEPAEWLHRVVRADGTLILPRLRGVDKMS